MLNNKDFRVLYDYAIYGVSANLWRRIYINKEENPLCILTKNLPVVINQYRKVRMILYDIYP